LLDPFTEGVTMNADYFIFLSLYLLGLILRYGYEVLKKTGRLDSRNRVVFSSIFAAMCMMWAGWFNMCALDPFRLALPAGERWAGFGAVILPFLVFDMGKRLSYTTAAFFPSPETPLFRAGLYP
jgi:hypothetical protein